MRQIHCKVEVDCDHLYGQTMTKSHYDTVVGGDEPCDVLKPDGSYLIRYRPEWFPADLCDDVAPVCRKVAQPTTNRGIASGTVQEGKTLKGDLRKDGLKSNTAHADPVNSGIVGFFDRNPRFPFCRQNSFVISEAASWKRFLPYIVKADEGFKELMPEQWAAQREIANRTPSDWVIPESTFTTVTVNRNWATALHTDKGDYARGFGVMSCLRNDLYEGGYLVFPKYRVAVNFGHRSIVCADVHQWHGNTKFSRMKAGFERITMVFYYRENMVKCLPAREEVAFAKRRKRGDSLDPD